MPRGTTASVRADGENVGYSTSARELPPPRGGGGRRLKSKPALAFLIDVDNTLLDNDRFHDDLSRWLENEFGVGGRDRFWGIFEALRTELGYVDYLGTVQRLRINDDADP